MNWYPSRPGSTACHSLGRNYWTRSRSEARRLARKKARELSPTARVLLHRNPAGGQAHYDVVRFVPRAGQCPLVYRLPYSFFFGEALYERGARRQPRRRKQARRRASVVGSARRRFNRIRSRYARQLGVGRGGQVHHAIELQVLKRYPGVFTAAQLNSPSNMRGIPPEQRGRRQLHNAKIREIWNRHYRLLNDELRRRGYKRGTTQYKQFVRRWLNAARDEIDYVLGQFFSENRARYKRP